MTSHFYKFTVDESTDAVFLCGVRTQIQETQISIQTNKRKETICLQLTN
jgi:hypothetical protein